MSDSSTPSQRITAAVTAWPGVEAGPGERGEFGFTVGRRQIGHLHGDRVAHFGFLRDVGAALRAAGRVEPHPVNRHSPELAARRIPTEAGVHEVLALLRLNHERETGRRRAAA